jgi:hypothetical protein
MSKTFVGSPVRKSSHPVRDCTRDWEWINEHLDEYRGQWVMVYEGQLIAADPQIRALINKVPRDAYPEAMVTYIPTEEEARRIVL